MHLLHLGTRTFQIGWVGSRSLFGQGSTFSDADKDTVCVGMAVLVGQGVQTRTGPAGCLFWPARQKWWIHVGEAVSVRNEAN